MQYLFRHGAPHIFLTTEDPEYRYEWLCGVCDYPVEIDDSICPRCQYELEDCPICTPRLHKRPSKRSKSRSGVHSKCPVCRVRRYPFGERSLGDMRGKFCTNLYGCPIGGMLLSTDEFAILPEDCTLCPICRHEDLPPLDVRTFRRHLNSCLFCSTIFEKEPVWKSGWSASTRRLHDLGSGLNEGHPCPICGRNDHLGDGGNVDIELLGDAQNILQPIGHDAYLRLAELGRSLALYDDATAFDRLFGWWLDSSGQLPKENESVRVSYLLDYLIRGTVLTTVRTEVNVRRDPQASRWRQNFPREGTDFRVSLNG